MREIRPFSVVHDYILNLMLENNPDINTTWYVCINDLNEFRAKYVEKLLINTKWKPSSVNKDVIDSIQEKRLVSEDISLTADNSLTFGERLSDKIAEFGGSWKFLISFGVILVSWIFINAVLLSTNAFDPFPFILLNLILSCLAAVQAPIIMMSQNRQEAKDRLRSENDYLVNLKAEIEIRNLNEKIDNLMAEQWNNLLKIQEVQTELIEEIRRGNTKLRNKVPHK